jgi:mannose-6-phosphate isomerase-like protein (cupin superfamily)
MTIHFETKEEPIVELKSTLKVLNEGDVEAVPGVIEGQKQKRLIGVKERPSERIKAVLATYKADSLEELHWHPIEALYFVVSGKAVVRDIEGHCYDAGPGTVIYAPAGIAGAHEWYVPEQLQLFAICATTDPERKLQFTVDKHTLSSKIEFDELIKRGGAHFKSLY